MKPAVALVAALMLLAVGCGTTDTSPGGSGTVEPAPAPVLTVFAAASLKSTFTTLGSTPERSHTGVRVSFSFAGSADLASQLQSGAPADVFAAADTKNMDKVAADGLVQGTPATFATNTLEIALPPDNPAGVTSFADLAKPGLKLVTCAVEVPCGAAAEKVQQAAGVSLTPVSEESSVTDVLGKVESGEADAGLVYVTDVRAAGAKVKGLSFSEAQRVVNHYPIAPLAASKRPGLARQFVALVTGAEGQRVLSSAGFGRP